MAIFVYSCYIYEPSCKVYQSVKTIMSYLATIALCLVGRVMPASVPVSEKNKTHNMDWVSYHSIEDIYKWFEYLETKYEFCKIEIIGKTFENRDMRVMKVSLHHLFYLGTSCAVTVRCHLSDDWEQ